MFLNFNYCRTSLLCKQNSPVFQKFVFHITHKNYAEKYNAKLPRSTLVNFKSATNGNGAGATTANNIYAKLSVKVKTKSIFICHKSSYSFLLSLLQTSKNTFAFQNKSLLNPTDTILHHQSPIKAQASFPFKTQDCQDATGSNISSSNLLSVNQPSSSDLRNLNLNEWKKTCSRQGIFSGFFKLIYMVFHGLFRILYLLGKAIFVSKLTSTIIEAARGKTANKVKEVGKKTASNVMKGAKKSGVIMAREMPKAMEALQKGIPIWLENLQEFSKRIDHELRQAKTQEERIARFSKILSTAVRKSTMYRNLKLVLFGYGIFLAVRFSMRS